MADSVSLLSRPWVLEKSKDSDFKIRCWDLLMEVDARIFANRKNRFSSLIAVLSPNLGYLDLTGEDEPPILSRMIQFFFTNSYDDQKAPVIPSVPHNVYDLVTAKARMKIEPPLIVNTKMYLIGDKYEFPELKALALQKYTENAELFWHTTFFPQSIDLIFENKELKDQELRNAAIQVSCGHLEPLLESVDFGAMLHKHGAVGYALLQGNMRMQKEKERKEQERERQQREKEQKDREQEEREDREQEERDSQNYSVRMRYEGLVRGARQFFE